MGLAVTAEGVGDGLFEEFDLGVATSFGRWRHQSVCVAQIAGSGNGKRRRPMYSLKGRWASCDAGEREHVFPCAQDVRDSDSGMG